MTRSALLPALLPLLMVGCDRAPPEPRPETNAAPAFDNAAAPQSIIQPEVAAANPPDPIPSPTPKPVVLRSVTIAFAQGTVLDDPGKAALDGLLAVLPPDRRLVVRGHSDAAGSDAANLLQSRRRAEAVRAYLVSRGVAATRIEVIALGERRPVAPNAHRDGSDDPVGRERNRRVEVEVLQPAARGSDLITPTSVTVPPPR